METNRKCQNPGCNALNPANAKFCFNCGTKMESFCAGCNAPLRGTDRFCPDCGRATAAGEGIPAAREAAPATPAASAAPVGPIYIQDPDLRLRRHAFNILLTELTRRRRQGAASPEATFRDAVDSIETFLSNLERDPDPRAAALAPLFTKTAFLILFPDVTTAAFNGRARVSVKDFPPRYRSFCTPTPTGFDMGQHREVDGVIEKEAIMDAFRAAYSALLGIFWGPSEFCAVEQAFAQEPARFAGVVCQSLRELFYLTYPTVALKKRFLSEEDYKLAHGYYPSAVSGEVKQMLGRLRLACEKMEKEVSPATERDVWLFLILPLTKAEWADVAAQTAARAGMAGNPYPRRSLTASEEKAMEWFFDHGLENAGPESEELLTVLLAMRDEQDTLASNWARWLKGEANKMMGQIDVTTASWFLPFYTLFEQAHYILTRYCNALGPRVRPREHQLLQHRTPVIPGVTWEKWKQEWLKTDKEWASALFPECNNIETVNRLMMSAAAAQAAPSPSGAHP